MKRSLITPKRVLILMVGVLVVTSLLPAAVNTAIARLPRTAVRGLLIPAQVMLRPIASSLRPGRAHFPRIIEDRAAQAKRYIDQLEQRIVTLNREVQRLTQSQALIKLGGVHLERARVAALGGDDAHPILIIDKGTSAGIRKNLAVVWGTALVGQVVSADPVSAEVQLIAAAGTRLQVRISAPRVIADTAPHETQVQWDAEHGYFYTDEAIDVPIHKGDAVQLADQRWQSDARGFFLGTVTRIARHPKDPLSFHRVIIRPALPLKSLTRVAVLVPVEQEPRR